MALYKCINEQCPAYNQEVNENVHKTYTKDGIVDHKIKCPSCGEDRIEIDEAKGFCTTTKGRPNVPNN